MKQKTDYQYKDVDVIIIEDLHQRFLGILPYHKRGLLYDMGPSQPKGFRYRYLVPEEKQKISDTYNVSQVYLTLDLRKDSKLKRGDRLLITEQGKSPVFYTIYTEEQAQELIERVIKRTDFSYNYPVPKKIIASTDGIGKTPLIEEGFLVYLSMDNNIEELKTARVYMNMDTQTAVIEDVLTLVGDTGHIAPLPYVPVIVVDDRETFSKETLRTFMWESYKKSNTTFKKEEEDALWQEFDEYYRSLGL